MVTKDRGIKISLAILSSVAIFAMSAFLSSCSQTAALPEDAWVALVSYWESLPSSSEIEYEIIRSWPGDTTGEEFSTPAAGLEVWCVESEIVSAKDPDLSGEKFTWIIFRENEKAAWSAYFLAAMSASWPYEACLDGIPK